MRWRYPPSGTVALPLRRAADSSRVEQPAATAVVAVDVELEDAGAFDEERAPFGKERLERGKIDDRRIGFDLAEVGVDRAGQRQAGLDRVLQVDASRSVGVSSLESELPCSTVCVFTSPTTYGTTSSRFGD